jgi:hypothetical protein
MSMMLELTIPEPTSAMAASTLAEPSVGTPEPSADHYASTTLGKGKNTIVDSKTRAFTNSVINSGHAKTRCLYREPVVAYLCQT